MEKLPLTLLEKLLITLSSLGLVWMFGYTFYIYPSLPDTIPIHYNFQGEPDGFGGKGSVWVLPCIATFLFALMMLITFIPPNVLNYPVGATDERKEKLYKNTRLLFHIIPFEIVALFTYIIFKNGEIVQGNQTTLDTYFIIVFISVIVMTLVSFIIRSFRLK
jgi:uncharacterized membrane protein